MKSLLIFFIRVYQIFLSPMFPPTCRFAPSCSQYFIEAINLYGCFSGLKMGLFRLLKCHPFHPGGWDPVPPVKK